MHVMLSIDVHEKNISKKHKKSSSHRCTDCAEVHFPHSVRYYFIIVVGLPFERSSQRVRISSGIFAGRQSDGCWPSPLPLPIASPPLPPPPHVGFESHCCCCCGLLLLLASKEKRSINITKLKKTMIHFYFQTFWGWQKVVEWDLSKNHHRPRRWGDRRGGEQNTQKNDGKG